eukprot:gnl/TRDRNA2_/TRDRNA2_145624_c4_seq1.p1 gnl/TRDRNA2_/TRDRNA2_145624_c4~~gnl/TRDRNA2_/TRDRNA2_145624_c4_seq1.p1  ORF type:complete len:411 (+),score=81.43 gnl/TRDRNA2_/TRDRNA2_145624_c4_seq1:3-1235(+)
MYDVTIYWVFTTLTTTGYGDITPKNNLERAYCIVVMFGGALVFGYITGSIAELAQAEEDQKGHKKMILREFCVEQNMSNRTSKNARVHFETWYEEMIPFQQESGLITKLAPALRKEVLLHIHKDLINSICLLQRPLPEWFVISLVRLLEPQAFSPRQIIVGEHEAHNLSNPDIYFVYRGQCEGFRWTDRTINVIDSDADVADRVTMHTPCEQDSPRLSPHASSDGKAADGAKRLIHSLSKGTIEENHDNLEVVQVYQPGQTFGFESMLVSEDMDDQRRCLYRCSPDSMCVCYVLRADKIPNEALGAAVQRVLADTIALQLCKTEVRLRNSQFNQRSSRTYVDAPNGVRRSFDDDQRQHPFATPNGVRRSFDDDQRQHPFATPNCEVEDFEDEPISISKGKECIATRAHGC